MNGKPTLIDQRLYKTVNGRIKETASPRYIAETVLHTFVLIYVSKIGVVSFRLNRIFVLYLSNSLYVTIEKMFRHREYVTIPLALKY